MPDNRSLNGLLEFPVQPLLDDHTGATQQFAPSTYARRQTSQEREYRVSSYEPTPIAAGETVAIAKDTARIMYGTREVGTLEKGREFKALRVVNGWLGAVVEENGQTKRGWIWHQDVSPVAATSLSER